MEEKAVTDPDEFLVSGEINLSVRITPGEALKFGFLFVLSFGLLIIISIFS